MKLKIAMAAALLAGACSPRLYPPETAVPDRYVYSEGFSQDTTGIGSRWWEMFGDPTLDTLVARALERNRDLAAAAARVERMRQLYRIDKASRLPVFSASVYANRETNDYYEKPFSNDPEMGAKASVSWELDLWGNLRWAKRRGGAEYLASVEDWRAMRMTLVAEVATAYFELMALDNELAIVRRTLETRREDVHQAKLRFEGGLTAETVYQQAQVEYATTAARIPDLERRIRMMENSISLLAGGYPGGEVRRSGLALNITMPDLSLIHISEPTRH